MLMMQVPVENPAIMAKLESIPNLTEKVFGIDLIREKILNHAIRGRKGQVCGSSVSSLRLVQKSWPETITKLLQKSKEPLFNLVLRGWNSLATSLREHGKLLDRFMDAMASKQSLPTFRVKMLEEVFLQETHSSLSRMLVQFGGGLVDFELLIPAELGGTLNFIFPNFTLPNLRKLQVELSLEEIPRTTSNNNVAHFINSLLNAAPALTHFVVPEGGFHDIEDFPVAFQLFTLPPSITTLELSCELTGENLELLVKSDLAKLTSLKLMISGDEAYPDGLLFRILDKCRRTLRELVLRGGIGWDTPRIVTSLRLPVMEKLEAFTSHSIHCELEPGISSLERFLPKLSRLELLNQTPDMFRKWTENSTFKHGPHALGLHLDNANVIPGHPDYMASVDLEMMQSLHLAFPNVRELDVTVSGQQVCGLKYLFLEIKTLTVLKIIVVGSTVGLDWDFWDALLIGVPIHFVTAFRRSIDFFVDGQVTNPSAPSIKNLQDLKHLSLTTHLDCTHDPCVTEPLISDLTFLLALLKMLKLRKLTLSGKFKASHEMAERWASQGRKLIQLRGVDE